MQNKYVKLHSLLRMLGALLAIIIFISMFIAKQIINTAGIVTLTWTWTEAFFGDADAGYAGTVFGFIGYIFVFLGGLAGLAFVFLDEMIGKDLTKKLSFVAGGLALLGGVFMLLTGVFFRAFNGVSGDFRLAAGPIVFGILALVVGGINVAAPILEDKGM